MTSLARFKTFLFLITATFVLAAISAFSLIVPPASYIQLQNERLSIIPKEFYIANVIDERKDKHLGSIIDASVKSNTPAALIIDLKGGVTSIKTYIESGLPSNKTLRPVVITVKALKVTETPLNGGGVSGQVALTVSFGLQRGEDLVHLIDYNGSASYQRKAGPPQQVEPLIRSAINNSLVYFNTWIDKQADQNIKLAKGVKVHFNDHTEPEEGDTIYYRTDRPLTWADFKGKPIYNSKYGAEVFASLGYNENVKLVKGIINIKIDLKVYAPKSACWVRDGASAYGLNHEQRHFDIVKLVAEHFKQQIKKESLTTDNYDGPINVLYFDALREIDKLQTQYDGDTQHSTNAYQQQQWDNKIDKELFDLGIKFKTS